ncbi:NRDE family protein [Halosegnis sp.]|uniref:NRDE family protein n=1 Tax=Halosegnis sp. TaxID=2864959 RepID=UPI0035D4DC1F
MCTLTFAWRRFDDHLAVAANRDESYDRPASPPAVRGEEPLVVAPRDEEAGGTWLGYNDAGVFAAVTNRWTRDVPVGDRSRGLLVRETLNHPTADAALAFVREELSRRRYEPFQLVLADSERALVIEHDGTLAVSELAPGVYVVGNTGWCGERSGPTDAADPQRTETFFIPGDGDDRGRRQARNDRRLLDALTAVEAASAADWLETAGELLGDHEYGVCVHGDGFGTRSASLVRLGDEHAWQFADGHPCETPFEPVDAR